MSNQVGSIKNRIENENEIHNVLLSADYQASSKLNLNGSALYNTAKGRYSNPAFSSAFFNDARLDYIYTADGVTAVYGTDPLYNGSYLNNMGDYSDLNYDRIEVSIGGTYQLTKNVSTSLTLFYDKFMDRAPYVTEDQDGDIAGGTATVLYKF